MIFLLLLVTFVSCETLAYAAAQDVPDTLAEIQTFADLRVYAQAADVSESTIESIRTIESTYIGLTNLTDAPRMARVEGDLTPSMSIRGDPSPTLEALLVQILATQLREDKGQVTTTVVTLTSRVNWLDKTVNNFNDRIDAVDNRIDWVIGVIVAILLAVFAPGLIGRWRRPDTEAVNSERAIGKAAGNVDGEDAVRNGEVT